MSSMNPKPHQIAWVCAVLPILWLAACDQRVSDAPEGDVKTVEVVFEEVTSEVDLGELDTVTIEGEELVRLSDVVEAADLGVELSALEFDFVASDGFRSGDRSTCTETIPMPGETLEQGYIDPVTRNMSWDASLGMPGCVRVRDAAQLIATEVVSIGD